MDEEIAAYIAEETGRRYQSDWLTVDQSVIDGFADVTGDRNFIHLDAEAAKEMGLDGTIAHGFLTLSLLAPMRGSLVRERFPRLSHGLNYGLDRVRFLGPVQSGSRIRGLFTIEAIEQTRPGRYRETMSVTVELEGREKPVLVARWLTMYVCAN